MSVFGAITKLRKATFSFVMSVRLSVRPSIHMEKIGSHWTDFHEVLYWNIFRNFVGKHFIVQLMHTNYKILRLLKWLKL